MPANLPPNYYELEREFKREKNPQEKLRLARELLALMPKHKGTEKLQADLKAKIARLRRQTEGKERRHGARTAETFDHIDREGAAQVIFIGPPNSGKSSLLDSLTNASPLIGDYPYTTREPLTGMMDFETIQIQLIDTPPISEEVLESFVLNLIRQADLAVLVVDVSTPGLDNRLKVVRDRLEEKRIRLVPKVLEELKEPIFIYKKTIIAAHKFLDENGDVGLAWLREQYPDFTIAPTSILDDEVMAAFRATIFRALEIIRIYTKPVGKEPDFTDPIILPMGGTVEDAGLTLHKDFVRRLQYAKVWGKGKFEGQRVKNNFVLSDGDIVEFHI
ncbi:MAG: 50S ribosome-binding GTPase [Candidatus Zixiibacteriota bacterium]|nr:MAG: 50S ribosome-binding GTPase [candidate division Zixibacteria bacterium]